MFAGKKINLSNVNVAVDGNSLGTPQFGSTPWPEQMRLRVNDPGCIVNNYCISGQSTTEMLQDAKTQIDPTIVAGKTNILFCMEVGNDLYFGRTPNLITAIQNYRQYCYDRRQAGWKVIAMTCYDRNQFATAPLLRQQLKDFNQWLRENWTGIANDLVDCWQDPVYRDADNTFYFPDAVHPNIAGTYGIAELAYRALLRASAQ